VTNAVLLGIVAVFTLNYALVRVPGWQKRGVPYWFVQVANIGAAAFFVAVGIPGLERVGHWLLALLFVFHAFQNEVRARMPLARSAEEVQAERREAYEQAIEEGRADARAEINRP
jgi:hypothetical protein